MQANTVLLTHSRNSWTPSHTLQQVHGFWQHSHKQVAGVELNYLYLGTKFIDCNTYTGNFSTKIYVCNFLLQLDTPWVKFLWSRPVQRQHQLMPNKGQKVQEPQTSLLIVHVTSGQTWLQWPVQLWTPKRMQYQPVPENKQCYYKPVYLIGLMGEGWKTHKLRINTWTFKLTGLVCKFLCMDHKNM